MHRYDIIFLANLCTACMLPSTQMLWQCFYGYAVVGWFDDIFVGVEREQPYEFRIGYQKGNPVLGPIEFNIVSDQPASNLSLAQSVDYSFNANGRTLVLDFVETVVEVIFLVDDVALEYDESAVLQILPLIPPDVDIQRIEGLFFRGSIDIIILDVDGINFVPIYHCLILLALISKQSWTSHSLLLITKSKSQAILQWKYA